MLRKIALAWVFVTFGSLLHAVQAESQDSRQGLQVESMEVQMQLEHVQLSFLVRDSAGNFIPNLTSEDFVLVENNRPQTIVALREQEVPISVVLMVDTSWSTGMFIHRAVDAAVSFFQGLSNESSAIVLFSEEPTLAVGWDDSPTDLSFQLTDVQPDGKTALHDSIIWVCQDIFQDRSGKKLIIVLTDGLDTISDSSFRQMMRIVRDSGVTLYPILYTNSVIENYRRTLSLRRLRPNSKVSQNFHNFILLQNEFVDQTMRYGGRTIFSHGFDDLGPIYERIIRDMKSQYVMLYRSDGVDDSRRRDVRVQTRRIPGKIFIDVTR